MYKYSFYNFIISDPQGQFYLLYNALYNSLYEISEDEFKFLKKIENQIISLEDLKGIGNSFKEMLIEKKIIIDKQSEEQAIIRNRAEVIRNSLHKKRKIALTLVPTNACNLDCIYCFEGEKKHKGVIKKETSKSLFDCLEKEILDQECDLFHVTWYGGEPMLGLKKINETTPVFLNLAKKNQLTYSANMITNGTLLNTKSWQTLIKNKIEKIQITIDGSEMTHNTLRPHVNKYKNSYQMILEALKCAPLNIKITLRINCDKRVAVSLPDLLKDLDQSGIWPHRAKQIRIRLARMIDYPDSQIEDKAQLFTAKEFYCFKEKFRHELYQYSLEWAEKNHTQLPRMVFKYPKLSYFFCATAHYPYSFAMDQYGFLYKCWDYVNDPKHRLHHISKPYHEMFKNPGFLKIANSIKFDEKECIDCKFLPICDSCCPIDRFENRRHCCEWKYYLSDFLIQQYGQYRVNPASMILKQQIGKTIN